MKKIIFLLILTSIYNFIYAAQTESSKPVASAPDTTTASANKTVVILAASIASKCDNTDNPCNIIKNSATQLSQAVNQNISDQKVIELIENSIVPQIDFYLMTKFVMGPAWKQASVEQQTQIVSLFKQLLVYQYSTALSKFKGAQVSIDSSVISGDKQNKAAVKGTVKLPNSGKSKDQPVNIEYDLAKINSNWKIYDVKIENVSIVTTYRTQFNETVQTSGVASLIKQLQAKVDNLKAKS